MALWNNQDEEQQQAVVEVIRQSVSDRCAGTVKYFPFKRNLKGVRDPDAQAWHDNLKKTKEAIYQAREDNPETPDEHEGDNSERLPDAPQIDSQQPNPTRTSEAATQDKTPTTQPPASVPAPGLGAGGPGLGRGFARRPAAIPVDVEDAGDHDRTPVPAREDQPDDNPALPPVTQNDSGPPRASSPDDDLTSPPPSTPIARRGWPHAKKERELQAALSKTKTQNATLSNQIEDNEGYIPSQGRHTTPAC